MKIKTVIENLGEVDPELEFGWSTDTEEWAIPIYRDAEFGEGPAVEIVGFLNLTTEEVEYLDGYEG